MGAGITGNRVLGATTHGHRTIPVNRETFQPDEDGIILTPAHVHRAQQVSRQPAWGFTRVRNALKIPSLLMDRVSALGAHRVLLACPGLFHSTIARAKRIIFGQHVHAKLVR